MWMDLLGLLIAVWDSVIAVWDSVIAVWDSTRIVRSSPLLVLSTPKFDRREYHYGPFRICNWFHVKCSMVGETVKQVSMNMK